MSDFYAYWNAEQIRALFEAIVFIVGGDDFAGLLRAVGTVAILTIVTSAMMAQRNVESFIFVGAFAFFYTTLLVPRMDMTIRDVRSANVYVVANVPLGVGFTAATASHVGFWLTEIFETAFAPADAEKFSRFGMAYPQRAVTVLQNLGAVTPQGRELINTFTKDCVVPEVLEFPAKLNQLVNAPDIWAVIKLVNWVNPARHMIDPTGSPLDCDTAVATVEAQLAVEVIALRDKLGVMLVPDHVNPSASIAASIPAVESLMLNMARSMDESLRQSIMLTAIPDGITAAGAAGEPLAMAINMSKGQGNLAAEINYKTMAEVAKDSLPKMRNAIEFVVIASFPFMLIMTLAAGHRAGTVIKGFFIMLLWVQFWPPLYAVINFLVITTDANPMNKIVANFGGNTLAAVQVIREAGASSQSIAGMLTLMVPVIAYALAKTSEIATTSMISGILAPAQSAAQSVGAQLSQGNVSMGNMSWGNVSTNNWGSNSADSSIRWADPGMSRTSMAEGTATRDSSGQLWGFQRTSVDPGFKVGHSGGVSAGVASRSSDHTNAGVTDRASLSFTASASSSVQLGADERRAMVDSFQSQFGGAFRTTASTSARTGSTASQQQELSQVLHTLESAELGGGFRSSGSTGGFRSLDVMQPDVGQGGTAASAAQMAGPNQSPRTTAQSAYQRSQFGADYGLAARTLQSIGDIATGKVVSASQQQRETAAQVMRDTLDSAIGSASNETARSALQSYRSSFDKQVQAAGGRDASVTDAQSASSETSAGRTSGLTFSSEYLGLALAREIDKQGGIEAFMRNAAEDPPAASAAVKTAVEAFSQSAQGQDLVAGGIGAPRSRSDVAAQGRAQLEDLGQQAAGAVAGARAENNSGVRGEWERSGTGTPQDPVDMGLASLRFNTTWQNVQGDMRKMERWTNEGSGAVIAAKAMTDDQKGAAVLASVAFLGGAGYKSPGELATRIQETAVQQASRGDTGLADTLNDMGRSKHATEQQLEFVAMKLRESTQPLPAVAGVP